MNIKSNNPSTVSEILFSHKPHNFLVVPPVTPTSHHSLLHPSSTSVFPQLSILFQKPKRRLILRLGNLPKGSLLTTLD